MSEPTISCPNCAHEIRLTESLAGPLLEKTRRQYEQALASKDRDIAQREEAVRAEKAKVEKDRAGVDEAVAAKISSERKRIADEEAVKAKARAAADLDAKSKELTELQGVLKERNDKLAVAQKAQADFERKARELEDDRREMALTIERQVQAGLAGVRDKAKQEAEEALNLRVAEKEEQIAGMKRQIEDLKRRAEQGSQQLQGEVLELELESLLRDKFPHDVIEPVPKGEFGGDLVQRVMGLSGAPCGTILWELKRTKNWSDGWIAKLREDQRRARADLAIIVSSALPKGVQTFDIVDGIWVTEFRCAVPIALLLRHLLVDVAAARLTSEGQQTKMELVYGYLTGPRFRQRVEAIVEKFTDMQSDLDKERKSMTRAWAKREAQITSVIEATAGMYGDLQGIAGKALREISGFELPGIEDQSDDEGDIAA